MHSPTLDNTAASKAAKAAKGHQPELLKQASEACQQMQRLYQAFIKKPRRRT